MPSSPEISQVYGEVRPSEVSCHVYSHAASNASGDVHAAAEVHVQLDRVSEHCQDYRPSGVLIVVDVNLTNQRPDSVGDDQLLEESPQHELSSVRQVLVSEVMSFIQLSRQLIVPRYRSLHDLREERSKESELRKALVRAYFPSVHVEQVSCRLEGVERYSQRNQHVPGNSAEQAEAQSLYVVTEVLEACEDAEVNDQHQREHALFLFPFRFLESLLIFTGKSFLVFPQVLLLFIVDFIHVPAAVICYDGGEQNEDECSGACLQIVEVTGC